MKSNIKSIQHAGIYRVASKKKHKKRKSSRRQKLGEGVPRTATLKSRAKQMREFPTTAESIFLKRLVELGIGYSFQAVIGFYIADFLVPSKMLVIEIDGGYHEDRVEYDRKRDSFIRSFGFEVWRIKNEDVAKFDLHKVDLVVTKPSSACQSALKNAKLLRNQLIYVSPDRRKPITRK